VTAHIFGLLCAAAVLAACLVSPTRRWLEQRRRTRESKARQVEWRAQFEAENPIGDPIGEDEGDAIFSAYRALTRQALVLEPDPNPVTDDADPPAQLGGTAWLADDEEWPIDAAGQRLEFVAQLDFARLPHLPGFPERGVARFFVGRDDLWGTNFDAPDQSGVRVLWHDGPLAAGRREAPTPASDDYGSPFQSAPVRAHGLALRPEPVDDPPDYYSWQAQALTHGMARRPGIEAVEDRIGEASEARRLAHKIGGHPTFTQFDFRKSGTFEELDVVLLGLTSDDAIMWGDVGEAVFLIRPDDLAAHDFSRVAFYWDCH
jgi:uncharacterized protein YwqG